MAEAEQTGAEENAVADVNAAVPTDADEIISLDGPTADDAAGADADDDNPDAGADTDTPDLKAETGDNDGEDADDDADTGDDDDGEDDAATQVFEFGGNKLEVPKGSVPPELAAKIDDFSKGTWSAFTKGQQENAERSAGLSAREDTVAKLGALNGEALQTYSYGLHLRSEIEQLSLVNLNKLWQSEPDRARQISDLLGTKQAEFQVVLARVGEQEQAVMSAQQEEASRRDFEGTAYLNKHIKNFSTEKAPALMAYVQETYGMSAEQAARWAENPVVTRMAYKAMLFDRQTGAAKRSTTKPTKARPVKATAAAGATSGATKDPNEMSLGDLRKHLQLVG